MTAVHHEFAIVEIAQRRRHEVIASLSGTDEVCDVHAITGEGDLLVR